MRTTSRRIGRGEPYATWRQAWATRLGLGGPDRRLAGVLIEGRICGLTDTIAVSIVGALLGGPTEVFFLAVDATVLTLQILVVAFLAAVVFLLISGSFPDHQPLEHAAAGQGAVVF